MIKTIFIVAGSLSLCLGIIGIFVPGLPTTPFLLLTAGLYVRSSERLFGRLVRSRFLGHYIAEYHANKGMFKKTKLVSLLVMWAMIAMSISLTGSVLLKWIIAIVGLTGTIVMGFVVPTVKGRRRSRQSILSPKSADKGFG